MESDLGCSCTFDAYDGDPADCYTVFDMSSNHDQRCCECGETIPRGTPHEYVSGSWDGFWMRYRTCLTCRRIRDSYYCTYLYGGLRESLWNDLGLDYITGDTVNDDEEE